MSGTAACPVCARVFKLVAINMHLDRCLAPPQSGAAASVILSPAASAQRTLGFTPLPHGERAHAGTTPLTTAGPPHKRRRRTLPPPPQLLLPLLSEPDSHAPVPDLEPAPESEPDEPDLAPAQFPPFLTVIAGRRRREGVALPGSLLTLQREPSNAFDPHAVLVLGANGDEEALSDDAIVLGYLPAGVAAHLAPLMDDGQLTLSASLGDADALHLAGSGAARLAPAWAAAAAQAAERGQPAEESQLARLRSLLDSVLGCESTEALLPESQLDALRALRRPACAALGDPGRHLALRMHLRRGPWFKLAELGEGAAAAAEQLRAAGLARLGGASEDEWEASEWGSEAEEEEEGRRDDSDARAALLPAAEARAALAAAGGCAEGKPAAAAARAALAALLRARSRPARAAWRAALGGGRCVRLRRVAVAALRSAQTVFFLEEAEAGDEARGAGEAPLRLFLSSYRWARYPAPIGPADGAGPAALPAAERVFPSAAALAGYRRAVRVERAFDSALERREEEAALAAARRSLAALGWAGVLSEAMPQPADVWASDDEEAEAQAEAEVEAEATAAAVARPAYLSRFTAAHVHARVAWHSVALLERARRYNSAVRLLRRLLVSTHLPDRRGRWWVRLATDWEHLGAPEAALAACEAGAADGWARSGEVRALADKALRLAKPPRRWRAPRWAVDWLAAADAAAGGPPRCVRLRAPASLRPAAGAKSVFAAPPGCPEEELRAGGECSVEALALAHYAGEGWSDGLHSEGGVWTTLFGLLFWDIVWDLGLSGAAAFQSPFQTAPLDLGSTHFAACRAPALARRLRALLDGAAPRLLALAWAARRGQLAAGVDWRIPLPRLQELAACVGGAGLAAIMRQLALDWAGWRGGMPDLVVWRTQPRPAARLVEVKGVNDRLRPQQRAWCDALRAAGVEVEVLQFERR